MRVEPPPPWLARGPCPGSRLSLRAPHLFAIGRWAGEAETRLQGFAGNGGRPHPPPPSLLLTPSPRTSSFPS
eukprot:5940865-Pyramimonas_sp.AAC.1